MDRGEVGVTLEELSDEKAADALQEAFETETGYRLAFAVLDNRPVSAAASPSSAQTNVVEIPVERVNVQAMHQGLALNPAKLNKAMTRTRRDGFVSPPILVRRLRDEYLLLDGLYRLRAAQTLGHTQIHAEIEG